MRGYAVWSLGRVGMGVALQSPRGREEVEEDVWVREEYRGGGTRALTIAAWWRGTV